MGKAERERMAELETTEIPEGAAVPTRRRPGPRPKLKPGPKPRAVVSAGTNGHGGNGAVPISALAALRHELATTEAAAGRIRKALAALQA